MFDLKGKAKWEQWNAKKGISKVEAAKQYVAKAQELAKTYGTNWKGHKTLRLQAQTCHFAVTHSQATLLFIVDIRIILFVIHQYQLYYNEFIIILRIISSCSCWYHAAVL